MEMERPCSKLIEVTIISAEGLLLGRKSPVRRNASVVVRSGPFDVRSTSVDVNGGSYPSWNEKLVMELPAHARSIAVEAYAGRKLVGAAIVPVTDFSGGYLPENYLSFLSYRLRNADGEKNGIVNISVEVKGASSGRGCGRGAAAGCSARPWKGVPVDGKGSDGAVVTGIPVSCGYTA